ncbi:MAG: vitamin B12-dependent ribonucleotide reductase [Myxococcota bacterium]
MYAFRSVSAGERPPRSGLRVSRVFSHPGRAPEDELNWSQRTALIKDAKGRVVFEQSEVEAPSDWSQTAVDVVASKYFRGSLGAVDRERSVRSLVRRVADTIADWGRRDGVFEDDGSAVAFKDELRALLLHQRFAFNSPVFFNVGVSPHPQCSACFINSVEDSMESILELARVEGRLFKGGSGTGTNLSTLRGSMEALSGGGTASGPVSFMRGFDAFAGVIKSGGKTRRAAKMVILNADHPDIEAFIDCKALEERKAWSLIEQGWDGSFDGEAYRSVAHQNANHSARVDDAFMEAVEQDLEWSLRAISDGRETGRVRARELMRRCAEAAHLCGDPGLQFDGTINAWNPCPVSGRINGSNPCSEYMFLDDTACNLGSLNLLRFLDSDGQFETERFSAAVRIAIIAQEIIVDNASYPTDRIATNSHDFRPLGLGYANLGALLMSLGLPYDSEEGRNLARAITALMSGEAAATSAELAGVLGPFRRYPENEAAFIEVMERHAEQDKGGPEPLAEQAEKAWLRALDLGRSHGFRNAQLTVLAPTGTIAFMMDCDSTGIEPDLALVKYKKLSGGGTIEIVNRSVPAALKRLGYTDAQRGKIEAHIDARGTIEGAPGLEGRDLAVFDCALRPPGGTRSISPRGHLAMMAAVQPFLSGAISKTVNMPSDATVDDVFDLYMEAWRAGLKSVAIYRDGSKRTQPLATQAIDGPGAAVEQPQRRKLEAERAALTHKFSIAGHAGYITVGLYPDGTPGEIFITMSKEGSTISGLMDSIATSISFALQYGVPLDVLVKRFSHMRFEPSGYTGNEEIPTATSIVDYIFRWLELRFSEDDEVLTGKLSLLTTPPPLPAPPAEVDFSADGPPCPECGALTVRSGACHVCRNCGATTGCS